MRETFVLKTREEMQRLERYIGIVGTIGNVAPFIGLFGTVLGVIRAFKDIAVAGGGGTTVVMHGIAEALVATAAGLFVAVPAVMGYNYLIHAVDRFNNEVENSADQVLDFIEEK